ncbi:MAG: Gfo/Idh/MocA family oxidoreductase [Oscillospiraceae bacterium]|nr:Gfo/Idh/MocA family oxidoreductase [Oscillospiraceae bacterium]
MGIKIGIVGIGSFSHCFIPLFKAHPLVSEITLCDIDADKLEKNSVLYGIPKKSGSLDRLLETDVDAVVIITQNWLHGPQSLKAIRAGKHVYSAVPAGISVEEIRELVKAVEETGKIYMMGETSYYYPAVIFCREKYKKGEFGHVVYGEGEYYHDFDHGLYEVGKQRGGERWLETAGIPPMYYPTHSTSQIVSVTGAHMTHVSCHGFTDAKDDGVFGTANLWKNVFSNQTALFKMSDGSSCRINEFRRIGHTGAVRMALFGTEGSFEQNNAGMMWLTKEKNEKVDDLLKCTDDGFARIHQLDRLPKELLGLGSGHAGSHQFLVDDFVKACIYKKTPPVNVWEAARYTVPGIIAHESAVKGGDLLEIPDFGGPKF